MGTIFIEQYGDTGHTGKADAPIANLNTLLVSTKDATTSSSAENITLDAGTRLVSVYGLEAHRVCITSDTTASKYAYIPATTWRDFSVNAGETFYYELDA
jgi:hypothetical protein